jgi:hypothetical protein
VGRLEAVITAALFCCLTRVALHADGFGCS